MSTIFYSWQSDRPTSVCRNVIEQCLQSAVDRLRADAEIESSLREDMEVDKDTKNVPGTPAIFDTITRKIAAASVFVPDLTFVGQRTNGRLMSNPNVLIEYGYSLVRPGSARIIAVMNDAYGKPSAANMPFNIAHTRFPITYTLAEDATADERKGARKALTEKLEGALRTIVESSEYKAEAESIRPPSALDVAALHQGDLDFDSALSALSYGDGLSRVRESLELLFRLIQNRCDEIMAKHDFGIGCGSAFQPQGTAGTCTLRTATLGIVVQWHQPYLNSLEGAKLRIKEFSGRLYLPGEFKGGVYLEQPRLLGETAYEPNLSRDYEIGWVKAMKLRQEASFVSNETLAENCVSQLLNLLRRERQRR